LDGLIVLAGEGMVVNDPLANPGPGQCMTIIGALLVLLGGLSADKRELHSGVLRSGPSPLLQDGDSTDLRS